MKKIFFSLVCLVPYLTQTMQKDSFDELVRDAQDDVLRDIHHKRAGKNAHVKYGQELARAINANKSWDLAKQLLDNGDSDTVNYQDFDGETVLMQVAGKRENKEANLALFSLLLDYKPDVNAQEKEGRTALHAAAARDNKKFAAQLLQSGADKDLRDRTGKRAVDYASSPEMKELLK